MPLVISAKISTDAGNTAKFGTDGNLLATAPPSWDGQPEYLIDNSWAPATPATAYWYPLGLGYGANSSGSISGQVGVAQPFMVSRACKITGWALGSTTTTSVSLYSATYSSNATTGMPLAKIADLGSVASGTGGGQVVSASSMDATVYQPRTLYWKAFWTPQAATTPTYQYRTVPLAHPLRVPGTQTFSNVLTYPGGLSLVDTTAGIWSGTLGPPTFSGATFGASPPYFWLSLTNTA